MIFLWHALQCAIDDGAGFGAGDGARRTHAAIGITADESELERGGKIFGEPFVATNIAEKPFLIGNVGVLEKSRGDGCKFRAADRCVWLKIAARIAADDAHAAERGNRHIEPVVGVDIVESVVSGLIFCAHIFFEQTIKHRRHFCAGDGALWFHRPATFIPGFYAGAIIFRITDDVVKMIGGVEIVRSIRIERRLLRIVRRLIRSVWLLRLVWLVWSIRLVRLI